MYAIVTSHVGVDSLRIVVSIQATCLDSNVRVVKPRSALGALHEAVRGPHPWDAEQAARIAAATTLGKALEACGWEVERLGNRIDKLFWEGRWEVEQIHFLFDILAPYVRSGSYLRFSVDESEHPLIYRFRNQKWREA